MRGCAEPSFAIRIPGFRACVIGRLFQTHRDLQFPSLDDYTLIGEPFEHFLPHFQRDFVTEFISLQICILINKHFISAHRAFNISRDFLKSLFLMTGLELVWSGDRSLTNLAGLLKKMTCQILKEVEHQIRQTCPQSKPPQQKHRQPHKNYQDNHRDYPSPQNPKYGCHIFPTILCSLNVSVDEI